MCLAVTEVRSTFAGAQRALVSVITTLYYIAPIICQSQVWYRTLSLRYVCI